MTISEETKRDCKIWICAFLAGGFSLMLLIRYLQPFHELSQHTMGYVSNIMYIIGTIWTSITYLRRTK